jgi:hypothetical protein
MAAIDPKHASHPKHAYWLLARDARKALKGRDEGLNNVAELGLHARAGFQNFLMRQR